MKGCSKQVVSCPLLIRGQHFFLFILLQVAGFGTRLMNWTKHYARAQDACEYFLTYADNAAVGYFSKQGFTKALSMPRERWHGFIKDYDGGTLMECYIHPTLTFTQLPEAVAAQRAALEAEVRRHSTGHVVLPGMERWKGQPAGGVPPLELGDIPGVRDAGWSEASAAAAAPRYQVAVGSQLLAPSREALAALFRELLAKLEAEKDLIWAFLTPVDPADAPDYYDVIPDPISLQDIRARLDTGNYYVTLELFEADVQRIFANARRYNAPDTPFAKSAARLSAMFTQWVNLAVHVDSGAGA